MISHHASKGLVWFDISSTNQEELAGLAKRYDFHQLLIEDINNTAFVSKFDQYDDNYLVVFSLPIRYQENKINKNRLSRISFVLSKNYLISCRAETIEQLEYFSKIFESNSLLKKSEKLNNPGQLFYFMIKRIYASISEDLDNIRDQVNNIDSKFSKTYNSTLINELVYISKELSGYKQALRNHEDVWKKFLNSSAISSFNDDYALYISDLAEHCYRNHEVMYSTYELLKEIRESAAISISAQRNNIMSGISVLIKIFAALIFISIITPLLPIYIQNLILGIIILFAVLVLLYLYFKKKKFK